MDRKIKWRTFWLAVLTLFAVLTLVPSMADQEKLPTWFSDTFNSRIKLGLDLQGGLHIVYSIDLDKAVDDQATQVKRDVETQLADLKIKGRVSTPRTPRGAVSLILEDAADMSKIPADMFEAFKGIIVDRECTENAERSKCFRVSSDYAESIRKSALEQAVLTVRDRINEKGIAEPSVIAKGNDIVVELPGLDAAEIAKTKDLIERTAKLEFKIVEEDSAFMKALFAHVDGDSPDPAAKSLDITANSENWRHDETGKIFRDYYVQAPAERIESLSPQDARKRDCNPTEDKGQYRCTGRKILEYYLNQLGETDAKFKIDDDHQFGYEEILPDKSLGEETAPYWRSYYLKRAVELGGDGVSKANVSTNPTTNRPEVIVTFTRWGGRRFGEMTGAARGRKMAIILDDNVKSAPTIQTRIDGGSSSITMGGGTPEYQLNEASLLVNVLRTGSLPAPLREAQSSEVGPLLGQDAIDKAKISFGLGGFLVLLIMVGYYRFSGMISMIALTLNITFMMALLAGFGATLTLPGIAALVLTIGMAVDANIIIYERIREELRNNKSVKGAVDAGFSRGFSAIVDGNLTTGVAAFILLTYGSGPIRGFAVMLLIGIACTLFTTTWCSRLFVEYYVGKGTKPRPISI